MQHLHPSRSPILFPRIGIPGFQAASQICLLELTAASQNVWVCLESLGIKDENSLPCTLPLNMQLQGQESGQVLHLMPEMHWCPVKSRSIEQERSASFSYSRLSNFTRSPTLALDPNTSWRLFTSLFLALRRGERIAYDAQSRHWHRFPFQLRQNESFTVNMFGGVSVIPLPRSRPFRFSSTTFSLS
ncbi:Hypothetical protein NTJ_11633 [Nesidiocoris tenuis]|uniref:Uncharacterized protein n=1 Tax=Nesidiocoris tenuis TaxID=355587 RepID=A0ABN7B357_9HEMI|nr:Hypothetical protein NTJ_11633 [Nesidiocoris tenuis]